MSAALRAEWVKLRTTRTWWALGLLMAAYPAIIGAFLTFAYVSTGRSGTNGSGPPTDLSSPTTVASLYAIGVPTAYVFSAVVGVLVITTEYRYRTLTPTFLAQPRRSRVLLAKLLVTFGAGLGYGLAALLLTVPVVAGVLAATGHPTSLGSRVVLGALARSVLAHGLWAALGVGLGMLVRSQVGAVVALVASSQLVEPLLRIGLAAWHGTRGVSRFLPSAAADALTGASIYTASGGASLLRPLVGGLVLLAYALALTAAGVVRTASRDVL